MHTVSIYIVFAHLPNNNMQSISTSFSTHDLMTRATRGLGIVVILWEMINDVGENQLPG